MAFLTPDVTYMANGVKVNRYLLTDHNPNKIQLPPKRTKDLVGVTIHNTEEITVRGTTMAEQYTRATLNGNMGTVRVHFYVDEVGAWQDLPLDWQGWHAADGGGQGNTATIAIECIGKSPKAEDNAARLAAYILRNHDLDVSSLYTHTYWLNVRDKKVTWLSKDERCVYKHPYKTCPAYIIPHWASFVDQVHRYVVALTPTQIQKPKYYVQVGAFASKENAERYLDNVKKFYPDAFIKEM